MKVLLVGPYDSSQDVRSFIAPPLGIWRICGFLRSHDIACSVFDPNLSADPYRDLALALDALRPDIMGFSLTSMTLADDLSLLHLAKNRCPEAVFIGGGIEAAFNYRSIFTFAPFDYCVLGEGEIPMLKICGSLREKGYVETDIPGLVFPVGNTFTVNPNVHLDDELFRFATFQIPYDDMPVTSYWDTLSRYCETGNGSNGRGKKNLREIRSIRLMTSNYCAMKCTFCSYTNFLNFSCSRPVNIVRLTADDIMALVIRIIETYPEARTLIFQDDMFISSGDRRILPLCRGLSNLKERNVIPEDLTFMATTRVDSMETDYLGPMRKAGFRLIGYGLESFSENVLKEYGKGRIYRKIEQVLNETLKRGIKPFLDIILVSPDSTVEDVSRTLNKCFEYVLKGCEVSIYPTVIPFPGADIIADPRIQDLILYEQQIIPGTGKMMMRGTSILPRDKGLADLLTGVNTAFQGYMDSFRKHYGIFRFPSRLRSLIYLLSVKDVCPKLIAYSRDDMFHHIRKQVSAWGIQFTGAQR